MQVLLDADILLYEVGFGAESGWQGEGLPSFDHVANLLDERINNICVMAGATVPPKLYLTGKGNFRYDIAKRVPYKTRAGNKPFHYYNIKAYIKSKYDWYEYYGFEADDALRIEQTLRDKRAIEAVALGEDAEPETIVCSRDKDSLNYEGWKYSWELGAQPSFGPKKVTGFGTLTLSPDKKKLRGTGEKYFYSQILTGDITDSIPGLPKCGPKKAFDILQATTTPTEAFQSVLSAYRALYGEAAEVELLEQGRLLHMTKELHPDGSVVLWELPVEAS